MDRFGRHELNVSTRTNPPPPPRSADDVVAADFDVADDRRRIAVLGPASGHGSG